MNTVEVKLTNRQKEEIRKKIKKEANRKIAGGLVTLYNRAWKFDYQAKVAKNNRHKLFIRLRRAYQIQSSLLSFIFLETVIIVWAIWEIANGK